MNRAIRIFYWTMVIAAITLAYATAADAQTSEQVALIRQEAARYDLDPQLLLAIAKVESNFNHAAVGALGEQGLFQLRPELHPDLRDSSLRTNVRVAARYLADLRRVCGPRYGSAFFVCYNTGPYRRLKDPRRTKYYTRVVNTLYIERANANP